jgi:hypothetical protein
MSNTYWLAIDSNNEHSSFEELKHRKVVANGWPAASLHSSLEFVNADDRTAFDSVFAVIFDRAYPDLGEDRSNVARIFWTLLNIKSGDIIVAIEGTKVRGIGQAHTNAISTYRHDNQHEYGNTVLYGFDWYDWDSVSPHYTPTTPAQSVPGIAQLQTEREQVESVWMEFKMALKV